MTTHHPADDRRNPFPNAGLAPEASLTPEHALSLAEAQRRRVDATHLVPVAMILLAWALAWGAGFLLVWMSSPAAGEPALPLSTAVTILGVLLAVAIAVSAVLGARTGRGLRGGPAFPGIVYGLGWTGGMVAVLLLGFALARDGADPSLLALYFPAAYAITVGVLFVAGAALFRAVPLLVLGAWVLVVGAAAPFAGTPMNHLLMSLLGGGGFLAAAAATLAAAAVLRLRAPGSAGASRG